jgi:hypothetical protein
VITRNELDRLIKNLPTDLSQEEWRIAASVATGVHNEKSLQEIVKLYAINKDIAAEWWEKFNFSDVSKKENAPRKKKKKLLAEFVSSNIGNVITAEMFAKECEVSAPTVYNYINANRSSFKKVGRGQYEVIDSNKERELAKK